MPFGVSTWYAPMCWVMPPASPAATLVRADVVEQRGLAVIDVTHDGDHGRTRRFGLGRFCALQIFFDLVVLEHLGGVAHLLDDEHRGVLVDGLVDGRHHAHVHHGLDDFGGLHGHLLRDFLRRDGLADGDFALHRRGGHLEARGCVSPSHAAGAGAFACTRFFFLLRALDAAGDVQFLAAVTRVLGRIRRAAARAPSRRLWRSGARLRRACATSAAARRWRFGFLLGALLRPAARRASSACFFLVGFVFDARRFSASMRSLSRRAASDALALGLLLRLPAPCASRRPRPACCLFCSSSTSRLMYVFLWRTSTLTVRARPCVLASLSSLCDLRASVILRGAAAPAVLLARRRHARGAGA